ncbi:MAG: hypothetical protein KAT15_14350, partial [Bacteroidales bacterium]|nr:hypothetical protein [Bacteroidales bacterium]
MKEAAEKLGILRSGIVALAMMTLVCSNRAFTQDHSSGDFGAYYTHIRSGAEWELYDRTGEFADIVVDLGGDQGRFVFWRGSSYLPYWENAEGEKFSVDEVIPRQGDGAGMMPDRVNTYSRVSLVEHSDQSATVHWRYLPEFGGTNPHLGVFATNFVDEYFTINSGGNITRTIRTGTEKIGEWTDPENQVTQEFLLTQQGIEEKTVTPAKTTTLNEKVNGISIVSRTVKEPVAWFKF